MLKAQTVAIISEKLVIKKSLLSALLGWMAEAELSPAEAAKILGMSPESLSDLMENQTGKFSIDSLVTLLTRAGKTVKVSVI